MEPLDKYFERNYSQIVADLLEDEKLFKRFYHIRWFQVSSGTSKTLQNVDCFRSEHAAGLLVHVL
jgi:hypothetical protein